MQRPSIKMFASHDKDGATFYVGRVKFPGKLNFENGIAFLFYPDSEQPELQFCPLDSPDLSDVFDYYKSRRVKLSRARHGNLPIELHLRKEKNPPEGQEPRRFYIGKMQFNGELDCEKGVVFLAFIADPEEEELQITTFDPEKAAPRKGTPQPQSYMYNKFSHDD